MAASAKPFNPSKHLKELFVSNLTGSSMLEIFSLSVIIPVLVLLRRVIASSYANGYTATRKSLKKDDHRIIASKNWMAYMMTMTLDFLIIVLPMLLVLTVLSDWVHESAIVLTLGLVFCAIVKGYGSSFTNILPSYNSLRATITSYRVALMIVTSLCILAVDFKIFPRRFAKTETYGTSWMDLGVGSFVLANALVSRQARNIYSRNWKTACQSTFTLIILGFGRLITTTGVDYQVHVGEYGAHWNFFFTLAAVSLLTSTINVHPKYCGILGLLILVGYEASLVNGLNAYLLSNQRGMDIISQNKEGFFSIFGGAIFLSSPQCCGYWGMYLVGVHLGYHIFFQSNTNAIYKRDWWKRGTVWVLCLLFWLTTIFLDRHIERVSRRMCNLAYVTLVLAVNLQVLATMMLSNYTPESKLTALEEAFNLNLLGSFLLANVLTGLVNLSVDTLSASPIEALVILIMYALVLCCVTGVLGFCGFRLKFW